VNSVFQHFNPKSAFIKTILIHPNFNTLSSTLSQRFLAYRIVLFENFTPKDDLRHKSRTINTKLYIQLGGGGDKNCFFLSLNSGPGPGLGQRFGLETIHWQRRVGTASIIIKSMAVCE